MRRSSLAAKISIGVLLAVVAAQQALAGACDVHVLARPASHGEAVAPCPEVSDGALHCQLQHEATCAEHLAPIAAGAADAKSGWPQLHALAAMVAAPLWRADLPAADARVPRLPQLVPEVRNISIALLNLRQ